ncbi:MAG: MarR family transcriptional regulator [Clostridia bacterium]|nr:MarR family transcriptional regulator [Clostridia bacterium]
MAAIVGKFRIIHRCQRLYISEQLKDLPMAARYYSLILAVWNNPGFSQDQLARHLRLNKSSIARAVAQLEEQSLVERKVCETDQRIIRVYPAAGMEEIIPRIRKAAKEWQELVTADLSRDELDQFQWVLDRIKHRAILAIDSQYDTEENP